MDWVPQLPSQTLFGQVREFLARLLPADSGLCR